MKCGRVETRPNLYRAYSI